VYVLTKVHPVLSQIPLLLSPSVRGPQPVTLPYAYNNLPANVPAAIVQKETLERIIADSEGFLKALEERHIGKSREFREWLDGVSEVELQEKRRIAPGYLDTGAKILLPERHTVKADTVDVVHGLQKLELNGQREESNLHLH
jgi:hypothetical protein